MHRLVARRGRRVVDGGERRLITERAQPLERGAAAQRTAEHQKPEHACPDGEMARIRQRLV
jgi:hypothetical protein